MNVGKFAEGFLDRAADVGIGVDWVDNLHVTATCESFEGRTETLQAVAEVLAAVAGNEDGSEGRVEEGPVKVG